MTVESAICYWVTGLLYLALYSMMRKRRGKFRFFKERIAYPFLTWREEFFYSAISCTAHWLLGFGLLWAFLAQGLNQTWLLLFLPLLLSSIALTELPLKRLNQERQRTAHRQGL